MFSNDLICNILEYLNKNINKEITIDELSMLFYFNKTYIDVLKELYLNGKYLDKYPCIADSEYYYLDCCNNYYICPGNSKKLGCRGDCKKCYSKECANEWEIMYRR